MLSQQIAKRSFFTSSPALSVKQVPLWINGREHRSSSLPTIPVRHPSKDGVVSEAVTCDKDTLELALASSRKAFLSWSTMLARDRRDIVERAVQLLEERKEEFKEAYQHDTYASDLVVHADFTQATRQTKEAASLATKVEGSIPTTDDGAVSLILREPFGTVFTMAPFNFGLTLSMRGIVQPMIVGNSVLLKGSPIIPTLHAKLGQLFKDAGLPDGVLNIVQFGEDKAPEMAEAVISDRRTRLVTFTGSVPVGKKVGEVCGRYLKPVVLELGGKGASIVLESADLENAAHSILFASSLHGGQICMATERAIVVDSVFDEFEAILDRKANEFAKEVPTLQLAGQKAGDKLQGMIDEALEKGAENLVKPIEGSNKLSPSQARITVLKDVSPESRMYTDETFAPSLYLVRARDADHAVELANSSDFGLAGSIWSRDIMAALTVAKKLECSGIHINNSSIHDRPTLPHGGHKDSGFGRFGGRWAIDTFTQSKTVTLHEGEPMGPWGLLK